MLCCAVQILKADSVARQAELQAQVQAVKKENQSLRNAMSSAARVHMSEVCACLAPDTGARWLPGSPRRASQVERLTTEVRTLRSAVGGVRRDSSRSSDEQLAQLADVNKALVNVIAEKDRLIKHQQSEVRCRPHSIRAICQAPRRAYRSLSFYTS